MAWQGKRLGDLVKMLQAEFGEHDFGRVDMELKPGQKEKAIAHFTSNKLVKIADWRVTGREDMDGIKLYLDAIGWVLVRASGTEQMLRVYAETTRVETTKRILDEVCNIVRGL